MERIKIDESLVPADLVSVADAPAHGVEDCHDGAASEHDDPREKQDVSDENENYAR